MKIRLNYTVKPKLKDGRFSDVSMVMSMYVYVGDLRGWSSEADAALNMMAPGPDKGLLVHQDWDYVGDDD